MKHHARLCDVAEITPGFSPPGAIHHEPNGRFLVIQPRHVDDSGKPVSFLDGSHDMRMDLSERAAGYCVHPGDVLFMSRGEKNRAAHIWECSPNAVPTVAFYILRPRQDRVNPDYLSWFLNQAPTQSAIATIRTGAGTPMVQRPLFEALSINLPPLPKQQQIAHLSRLQQQEHEIMNRLAAAVTLRNRGVGTSLTNLNQPSRNAE